MSNDSHGPIQLRSAASLFPNPQPDHSFIFLTTASRDRRVLIHHPGYEAADDLLLILYAPDHEKGGLHHGFVLAVCTIVADNVENGYLSRSASADAARIAVGVDDVLVAGDYYFHVPSKGW